MPMNNRLLRPSRRKGPAETIYLLTEDDDYLLTEEDFYLVLF